MPEVCNKNANRKLDLMQLQPQPERNLINENLSFKRLLAYQIDQNELISTTMAQYLWNIELSKALYPLLHLVEVSLRNRLNVFIGNYLKDSEWLLKNNILKEIEKKMVVDAQQKLLKARKIVNNDNLVAELSFGFWTNLIDRRYEQVIWPQLLKPVFPGIKNHMRTRKIISNQFNHIRKIRNRIFHYERIWNRSDLLITYEEMLQVLNWMCSEKFYPIGLLSNFEDVYLNYKNKINAILKSYLEDKDLTYELAF